MGVPVSEIRSLTSVGNNRTIGFRIISSYKILSFSVLYFIRGPRYCAENTQNVKYKVTRVNYNSCKGKLGYNGNKYVGPANALEL